MTTMTTKVIKLKLVKSKPKPPKRKKIKLKLVKPKPKQGRLAKVSVYEFVNDWLPEQLRSKIMAYAISDPHKEGIIKAQTHRRIHWATKTLPHRQQWIWSHPFNQRSYDNGYTESSQIPYNKIRFYDFDKLVVNCCQWADEYEYGRDTRRAINLRPKMAKLKHTNPLLYELWSLHLIKSTDDPYNQFKFIITKKQLTQLLKDNKVKGRTDLMFGCQCSGPYYGDTLWENGPEGLQLPPPDRRKAVKALMSI